MALVAGCLAGCAGASATGQRESGGQAGAVHQEAILGEWVLDPQYGKYEDTLVFRAEGTSVHQLHGVAMKGRWERRGDGAYKNSPSGEGDYLLLQGDVLEAWDADGLIKRYRRSR